MIGGENIGYHFIVPLEEQFQFQRSQKIVKIAQNAYGPTFRKYTTTKTPPQIKTENMYSVTLTQIFYCRYSPSA